MVSSSSSTAKSAKKEEPSPAPPTPPVPPPPSSGSGSGSGDQEEEEKVSDEYQLLCRELNMDSGTIKSAWESYLEIKKKYTLEGHQLHWLACALYVACHNSMVPTVGREGVIEGNGVSLTRLLRCCKLSLIQFFNKAKKWADMSNLTTTFRSKIDSLERNFAVCNVIFKKYGPIFVYLFKDPAKDPPKVKVSRKQKKPPCTPGEVFDFCWGLFVRVKTDFPAISDDLVNSYHLLLSCVDYVYGNAALAKRTDLLNEDFKGGHAPLEELTEPPCILDLLCTYHDGINAEVKSIREHWWKPHIKKFFDQKLLRGDSNHCAGILEPAHFENNSKNIRKDYEAYVLSIGDYDERIFLGEDANEDIGTPSKIPLPSGAGSDLRQQMAATRRNFAIANFEGGNLIPTTPLSGRHFLKTKEQMTVTPVSTATYLVSRLNHMLNKRGPEPGPKLLELFQTFGNEDPSKKVTDLVKELGDTFCSRYTTATESHPGSHNSFARMRLKMGVALYYKLLEAILISEQKKKGCNLKGIFDHDLFHRAMFTCCLEIVLFSYNSLRTFPWVLDTYSLEAIHFYKVIEPIIRNEDLPREVVKHLQKIEEKILESRAWTRTSPLWESLANDPRGVPSCEEVSLPGSSVGEPQSDAAALMQSPVSHHKRPFSIITSPLVSDRFKSPVVSAVARRQLAFGESGNQIVPTSPVRAGQSLLASPQRQQQTYIQVQGGQTIPLSNIRTIGNNQILAEESPSEASPAAAAQQRPKRPGSLGLFFRKVYQVAHLRLEFLCKTLGITDEEIKRKIWTTFEYTLIKETDLMKDRHLDQLIMCSLYIVFKVVGQNKTFTDIMKHYRSQPQAASHVYRSVLLGPSSTAGQENRPEENGSGSNPPPTPTRLAATSTNVDGEERGDLIKFYNNVFMQRLQEFSLRFKRSRVAEAPPLSPLPKLRAHPQSPCRKVSDHHSVYIRPLKATPSDKVSFNPHSPHKPLSYSFSRSPAKDLTAINTLMRSEAERKSATRKRLLADDGAAPAIPAAALGMEQQVVLVSSGNGDEPPMKMQIIPAGSVVTAQTTGAVNTRLELVLGDRTTSTVQQE